MLLAPSIYFYPNPRDDEPWEICNCLVFDGPEMLILDPGPAHYWPERRAALEADGLDPARLGLALFTHSHRDHLGAATILERDYGTALAMHPLEADFLATPEGGKDGPRPIPLHPWRRLDEGPWAYGGRQFQLFLTPGHGPGGLSLYWPEGKLLAVGDLYFPGTIGGVHYPGGSPRDMYASVPRVEALTEVDTVVCGHLPLIVGRDRIRANYEILNQEIAQKKAAGIF